ncbi:alkaline phosphatase [Shewanella youngdeokensis]|uniref:Alkaline phosphatase n=1 Tax=Shewanella youngdeokensis TaxID=2999068 RepID=A0ABZ0K0G2_9GAMM|nr:alkaline phosphatase [Shewanella sp. DAU334]
MNYKNAVALVLSACTMLPLYANANITEAPARPKNMIIMVGDGMGPAYTSAYRYFQDNPSTEEIESTVFDRLLVGMASTYPARVSGYVTDSAASATALATGNKSYNGAIGVDVNKQPLTSIMEMAKLRGMSTGVAVTSQVNHATPGAFLAHNESRKNYEAIAEGILESDADVILGGGQKYFSEELLAKFNAKGYQHITELSQLESIDKPKVLGLFADVQMPWVLNSPDANTLSKLTSKALALLSQNEKGFVLLVEGSLIDWAGHNNDVATAMAELNGFANAIEVVEQYVRQHKDTLMVVTADHNTGGLSVGANGTYRWDTQLLKGISATPASIASKAVATDDWQAAVKQQLGFEVSADELQKLSDARDQDADALEIALKKLIDVRSYTGWTTGGHTGVDVQVFAAGPAADLFKGNQDNTHIAEKMMSLLPKLN